MRTAKLIELLRHGISTRTICIGTLELTSSRQPCIGVNCPVREQRVINVCRKSMAVGTCDDEVSKSRPRRYTSTHHPIRRCEMRHILGQRAN